MYLDGRLSAVLPDNFQDRFLYLTKSNLDRFDEGVFGPVLRSMSGNYGTLVLNREWGRGGANNLLCR